MVRTNGWDLPMPAGETAIRRRLALVACVALLAAIWCVSAPARASAAACNYGANGPSAATLC